MPLSDARHAGILLPLFSMPSSRSWGIGEIADIPLVAGWLHQGGQDLLQLLPINEMAVGQRSPYSAMTAMAIDPIYISVHALEEFQAIGGEQAMSRAWQADLAAVRSTTTIDYARVRALKEEALRASFERFVSELEQRNEHAAAFRRWCDSQSWWLRDYALFRAIHAREQDRAWTEWPAPLRDREPQALDAAREALASEVLYREWLQWVADDQWQEAKRKSAPVSLLGDLPFMVDGDSADVWSHADEFDMTTSVGAPPDAFSETGQNWGLPVYRWDVLASRDFDWLRQRARRSADLYDGYRVDHLVGFYRTYVFPADEQPRYFTPEGEEAQRRLGETLLGIFGDAGARIIAEDLGTIPDFVRTSLRELGIPGYRVFRWERRWKEEGQPFIAPASYPVASVATTGTHDTETLAEWWEGLEEEDLRAVVDTPGLQLPEAELDATTLTPAVRDAFLEVLFASGSNYLLLPIQDVFGWRDRVNIPGTMGDGNWTWRLPWPVEALATGAEACERANTLRRWSELTGRLTDA
jgi:4-alpha-glucanotransferase